MPHGAPGVKFYAFEGVDSGKEPIRVQRYLEKKMEKKTSFKLPKNGGVFFFFWRGGHDTKTQVCFFSLCDFIVSTSFSACLFFIQ